MASGFALTMIPFSNNDFNRPLEFGAILYQCYYKRISMKELKALSCQGCVFRKFRRPERGVHDSLDLAQLPSALHHALAAEYRTVLNFSIYTCPVAPDSCLLSGSTF